MKLDILTIPNNILTTQSTAVEDFSTMPDIIKNMVETASLAGLVGLAGNQIGILNRVFIVGVHVPNEEKNEMNFVSFINPVVKGLKESGRSFDWEGCGSIPNVQCLVERWNVVTVKAQRSDGEFFEMTAKGLAARIIQHENDHINRILITSKARQIKRG